MRILTRLMLAFAASLIPALESATAGPILLDGTIDDENGWVTNLMVGYDFTVNADDLSLTSLGFWDAGSDGLPRSFQVGLWERGTSTLLASAVIDNADTLDSSLVVHGGSWRYETLSTAVSLTNGATYTLAYQTGSSWIPHSNTLKLDLGTAISSPHVTIDRRRHSHTSDFVIPTTASTFYLPANVNAVIESGQPVPEPSSLALLGMGGLTLLGYGRRRRSRSNQHQHGPSVDWTGTADRIRGNRRSRSSMQS